MLYCNPSIYFINLNTGKYKWLKKKSSGTINFFSVFRSLLETKPNDFSGSAALILSPNFKCNYKISEVAF